VAFSAGLRWTLLSPCPCPKSPRYRTLPYRPSRIKSKYDADPLWKPAVHPKTALIDRAAQIAGGHSRSRGTLFLTQPLNRFGPGRSSNPTRPDAAISSQSPQLALVPQPPSRPRHRASYFLSLPPLLLLFQPSTSSSTGSLLVVRGNSTPSGSPFSSRSAEQLVSLGHLPFHGRPHSL
jgi:hypothetical protein